MLVSDFLKSCSHGPVAGAAVASIGGDFEAFVSAQAGAQGQSVGDFAADHVRSFVADASERDWRLVAQMMRGEDLALLAGLEMVVRRMVTARQAGVRFGSRHSAPLQAAA